MMKNALITIAGLLEEYLKSFYEYPEQITELSPIISATNVPVNKLCISLFNIERETAMGISANSRMGQHGAYQNTPPPWHLNIYIIIAAVYEEKRYIESLDILSTAIVFLQQHPKIDVSDNKIITIEPLTLGADELNNIWGLFGGKYHPSIVCKLRGLSYDGNELSGTSEKIKKININP